MGISSLSSWVAGRKNGSTKTSIWQSRDGTTKETRRKVMALTRDFKETVRARVLRDPVFRRELLREGVERFIAGDVETGKTVLRDYINATIGFNELAEITHHSPKSLMRMLGPSGNPYARNLFEIVSCLQRKTGVHFKLKAFAAAGR
jgi:DNA-binding phage protein